MSAPEVQLLTATLSGTNSGPTGVGLAQHGAARCCHDTNPAAKTQDESHALFAGEPNPQLNDILIGKFAEALARVEAQHWLRPHEEPFSTVPDYFQAVERQLKQKVSAADSLLQLQTAVASFNIFVQANLTG